jgi:hypothetical protein
VSGSSVLRRAARIVRGPQYPCFPVRQITRGPKHHWFGYYDKLQQDPTGRYILGMEVDFEHSSPRHDDRIRIGVIDLADQDRWIEIGTSSAWCWQQGCMLQWRPGSHDDIIWNDRINDRFVTKIFQLKTHFVRTVPNPVYSISPDGNWAIAPDFNRLNDLRPGYGYTGIPDPNRDIPVPDNTGIFKIDLNTGRCDLILSMADIVRIPFRHGSFNRAIHWFNHLLINPGGSRFTFLHRWKHPGDSWHASRLITASADGSDVRILNDSGWVSHFIWRDPEHVLAYSKTTPGAKAGLYLYQDRESGRIEHVAKGIMRSDGHVSYSKDGNWILYDSYPDKHMNQHVYLYNVRKHRRIHVGSFYTPAVYRGSPPQHEWRCDLHPRFCRDGKHISIDSPHTGQGRQIHLIDISALSNLI